MKVPLAFPDLKELQVVLDHPDLKVPLERLVVKEHVVLPELKVT